jgi:hypothetical protein
MHKKSQKCYISGSCEGGTPGAISMKFGPLVHVINVINFAKVDHCNFNGLNLARSKFTFFVCLTLRLIQRGLALTRCL